jgi:hypothetical protein
MCQRPPPHCDAAHSMARRYRHANRSGKVRGITGSLRPRPGCVRRNRCGAVPWASPSAPLRIPACVSSAPSRSCRKSCRCPWGQFDARLESPRSRRWRLAGYPTGNLRAVFASSGRSRSGRRVCAALPLLECGCGKRFPFGQLVQFTKQMRFFRMSLIFIERYLDNGCSAATIDFMQKNSKSPLTQNMFSESL